jgi:hypothetical protein
MQVSLDRDMENQIRALEKWRRIAGAKMIWG